MAIVFIIKQITDHNLFIRDEIFTNDIQIEVASLSVSDYETKSATYYWTISETVLLENETIVASS